MKTLRRSLLDPALALDRLANALLLGDPDETISSRLGRWAIRQDRGLRRRIAGVICGALDALDPGHCAAARARRQRQRDRRHHRDVPWRR